jgi:hypothetical protein
MVNFNTNEIKVALYQVTPEYVVPPLSNHSIINMTAAITEAFDRKCNSVLVFVFCHHVLPTEAGHQIHLAVTGKGGQIVSCNPGLLVIMTDAGKSITVYFIGGIGTFFTPPAPDSSRSESSDDDIIEVLAVRQPQQKRSNVAANSGSTTTKKNNIPAFTRTKGRHHDNIAKNRNISNSNANRSRLSNNTEDSDSSFEDAIGLTQELH